MQQAKPNKKTKPTNPMTSDLHKLQNLISQLNNSLLKLTVDRGQYYNEVNACSGLCKEIKELMNATTKRITPDNER